jgi:hypothetical protein
VDLEKKSMLVWWMSAQGVREPEDAAVGRFPDYFISRVTALRVLFGGGL